MSVADSLYNLQLIKEFCESSLQSCCPLAVEDLLYAPPVLHVSMFNGNSTLRSLLHTKFIECNRGGQSVQELLDGSASRIFSPGVVTL